MDNAHDNELINAIRSGDSLALDELMSVYKSTVNILARPYFLSGADYEDLVQEGLIGLFKAINTYSPDLETTFYTYACSCIKNKLLDAIKLANREKHRALNSSLPITEINLNFLPMADSPEELTITKENNSDMSKSLNSSLSQEEIAILKLYLQGLTYTEISSTLGKTTKYVDNSLQRIKKILKKIFPAE